MFPKRRSNCSGRGYFAVAILAHQQRASDHTSAQPTLSLRRDTPKRGRRCPCVPTVSASVAEPRCRASRFGLLSANTLRPRNTPNLQFFVGAFAPACAGNTTQEPIRPLEILAVGMPVSGHGYATSPRSLPSESLSGNIKRDYKVFGA